MFHLKKQKDVITELEKNNDRSKVIIALLDFESQGVSQIYSSTLSDIIQSFLINSRALTVVERKDMEKIIKEQNFQLSGCTTNECAVKVGKILNARKIFLGSINFLNDQYFINIRSIDVETGENDFAIQEKFNEKIDIEEMGELLSNKLIIEIIK